MICGFGKMSFPILNPCVPIADGLQFNDEKYAGSLPSQFNALMELLCPDRFNPFSLQIPECVGSLAQAG